MSGLGAGWHHLATVWTLAVKCMIAWAPLEANSDYYHLPCENGMLKRHVGVSLCLLKFGFGMTWGGVWLCIGMEFSPGRVVVATSLAPRTNCRPGAEVAKSGQVKSKGRKTIVSGAKGLP